MSSPKASPNADYVGQVPWHEPWRSLVTGALFWWNGTRFVDHPPWEQPSPNASSEAPDGP